MAFGFIIPTCCRNDIHLRQLHRCIGSVRRHHSDSYIILINDSIEKYDLLNEFKNDDHINVIESYNRGSADQQVFKVLLETDLFDKAVFIQDSMLLNKKLENIDGVDIKFIWHFTNHRVHWDIIKEPRSEYNSLHGIVTHTDLIRHNVLRDYSDNKRFQSFCVEKLSKKHEWVGSLGSCCIVSRQVLKELNSRVNFIENFLKSTSNRDRRVNESVFPLICHFSFPEINFENSYDGLYYNGFEHGGDSRLVDKPTGFDNLKWCSVHNYFSKVSFNR